MMFRRLARILTDRGQNDIQRISAIYDTAAPTWDDTYAVAENRVLSDAWRQGLADSLYGDVLEIGAGTGETLKRLIANPARVTGYTGVDISTGMLAELQRHASGAPFPVTVQHANAENLAMFPDQSFDCVTCSLLLCTVPDPKLAMLEMARVCKPNGRIVLIEHVLAPNPIVRLGLKMAAPVQARHIACHLDRQTDKTLREVGFRIEREESRWFGIFRFIIARPPHAPPHVRVQ